MSIVHQAEQYVRNLLQDGLTADHTYHNLPHTQAVVEAARLLAARQQLPPDVCEMIELAAWFHDTGYVEVYENNEVRGAAIAAAFLNERGYPAARTATVERLICATDIRHQPTDDWEQLLRDADLSNMGRADYMAVLAGLRHEWAAYRNERYEDVQWYLLNYDFVKNHQYHTALAQEIYGVQHKQNEKILKKLAGLKPKKAKPGTEDTIGTSKTAQMMFKTALRNHMDLSNLADNKANIMLSVNALIITIAVPMGVGYIADAPHLIAPLIILLLTCLSSMIFATLATRPMAMTGLTKADDIKAGRANLFFFGNFYRMSLKEYDAGMDVVVSKTKNLEAAIKRDLYFLGLSLGRKYNQLRICYNLFIIGIVLSIVFFGVSYAIFE